MKIIKNGTVVLEDGCVEQDVAIDGEKILGVGDYVPAPEDEVIDASGCYVFPGFIDPHTHFDMTNAITTTADNYASGSEKAILGGTTTVINFASPKPGEEQSLHKAYERERAKADGHSSVHYKFHMEILDFDDEIAQEIREMPALGVHSFKIYMAYGFAVNDEQILKTLQAVRDVQGVVEAHCENGLMISLLSAQARARGEQFSAMTHPKTRPAEAEAEAIDRLAYLGRLADWPVHVVHLSTRLGLEAIRHHRAEGTYITAETCPQYFLLDQKKYEGDHKEALKYIMSPPLRTFEDRQAILEGIFNEEIQTLATDHCAYRWDNQKIWGEEDIFKTPGGAPGVGERVPLAYTHLLHQGGMAPEQFVDLLSTNAAKLYHLYPQKGHIAPGAHADLVLYEKEGVHYIQDPEEGDRMDYNTYAGMEVHGRVRDVFLMGEHVVQDGQLVHPHQGRYAE